MNYTHGGDIWRYEAEYRRKPIDFSSNISPCGMTDGVRAALRSAAGEAEVYPDPLCRELRQAIGNKYGFPADNIVCGNGAADLIWRIALALKPKRAVLPAPTFSEYGAALTAVGCDIVHYHLDKSRDFDLDNGILTTIDHTTDIVFLCEPNNPTGRVTDNDLLEAILRRCRDVGAVLVIDGSFADFLESPPAILSKSDTNLIILRSMTKIYAMAGVRLGWCACVNSSIVGSIARAGQPWPVSVFAQRAGIAALREDKYVESVRKYTATERDWLAGRLREMGLRVVTGCADFLLFHCENTILKRLEQCGIIIRVCGDFAGLDDSWYRIAVRRHGDNVALTDALREALKSG